jgi:hypothetical protein
MTYPVVHKATVGLEPSVGNYGTTINCQSQLKLHDLMHDRPRPQMCKKRETSCELTARNLIEQMFKIVMTHVKSAGTSVIYIDNELIIFHTLVGLIKLHSHLPVIKN